MQSNEIWPIRSEADIKDSSERAKRPKSHNSRKLTMDMNCLLRVTSAQMSPDACRSLEENLSLKSRMA